MNDFLRALLYFNEDIPHWLGWKKIDENGNKIPNEERMQYKYIKILDERATLPTEKEIEQKIKELNDADTLKANDKISAHNKLKALGLTDAEIKAL